MGVHGRFDFYDASEIAAERVKEVDPVRWRSELLFLLASTSADV
jgi:hypothetical protein